MLANENCGPCHGINPLLETARIFLGQDILQNVLYNLQRDFGQPQPQQASEKEGTERIGIKDIMDGVVNMMGGEEFVQDVLLNMSGAFKDSGSDGKESEQAGAGSTESHPKFSCPMASQFFKEFATMNEQATGSENKESSESASTEFRIPTPAEFFQELGARSKTSANTREKKMEVDGSDKDSSDSTQSSVKIPSVSQFLRAFYEAGQETPSTSTAEEKSKERSSESSVRPKGSAKEEKNDEKNEFKVEIKADGFQPEDITVKVKDGFLFVQAVREETDAEEGITRTQKLDKKIKLPSHVDPDEITCQFSEGVLTFLTPSTTKPKERVLDINMKKD